MRKIPQKIKEMIADENCEINETGFSGAQVQCYKDVVLKIEKEQPESNQEHTMLRWLQGRLPVPRILASEKADGYNYLLMSKMNGEMSCEEVYMEQPAMLVKRLAEGLQMFWNLDITDCPCKSTLEEKLRLARFRVQNHLCSTEDVQPDTCGDTGFRNPQELLGWLEVHRPNEELVFSHGDYCLPNIFLKDNKVSGFIDLGRSGIADKYQDIAICYRSLKYNYEGRYGGKVYPDFHAELLFQELGITPDWYKIRYYILLDELF